jgi:hypothetical protein
MAYVLKNKDGEIVASSPTENIAEGWEEVDKDNHAAYVLFLEKSLDKTSRFRESDIQLVRVLEDLVSLLIDRDVIRFTDLPPMAQKRLNDRESMRKETSLSSLMVEKDDFLI